MCIYVHGDKSDLKSVMCSGRVNVTFTFIISAVNISYFEFVNLLICHFSTHYRLDFSKNHVEIFTIPMK